MNYLLLQYDAKTDLQEANGYECFSDYSEDSQNEILVSKCFANSSFQLVVLYESESRTTHSVLYVDDVFNGFKNVCIEVDYGNFLSAYLARHRDG